MELFTELPLPHAEVARRLLERSLGRGVPALLTVQGGCMRPLLESGDRALVRPVSRPRAGDVVLARDGDGTLVCHRVLRRDAGGVLLAGDRSPAPELLPPSAVLGRVDEVRAGGRSYRLDRLAERWLGRLAAALHLLAWRAHPRPAGRWLDALGRRVTTLSGRALRGGRL